eukprot:6897171-Pyramimonas_sp.AAC.1
MRCRTSVVSQPISEFPMLEATRRVFPGGPCESLGRQGCVLRPRYTCPQPVADQGDEARLAPH